MFYSQLELYFNRYTNTNDALVDVCIDKKFHLKRFPRLEHTNQCDRIRCLCGANVGDNLLSPYYTIHHCRQSVATSIREGANGMKERIGGESKLGFTKMDTPAALNKIRWILYIVFVGISFLAALWI